MEHYFTNNQNLRSELRSISYEKDGKFFTFLSDLGVFSKNKIDFGSQLLLNTILQYEKRCNLKMLDVGCGYGFLGIVLSKFLTSEVLMVDVNKRAVHLCERNIKENGVLGRVIVSNVYESVDDTFDIIVTNPPIRAGKKVVLDILLNAKNYLKQDGELWFVIRKDQGAKSIQKEIERVYKCEILKKDKGFYVMCAKMH